MVIKGIARTQTCLNDTKSYEAEQPQLQVHMLREKTISLTSHLEILITARQT